MYNNGGTYGSGHLVNGINPLQLTSAPMNTRLLKLSFLNPTEQAKFEQLFSQNVSSFDQQLTGEAARDVFLRSKLDSESLAQIWSMADTNATGSLTFPEFALAMYLINLKLTGQNIPNQLPHHLRQEIVSAMQLETTPNVGIPNLSTPKIGTSYATYSGYHQSGSGILGVTTPLSCLTDERNMAYSQHSGYRNSSLTNSQWAVTPEEKTQFDQIFKSLDNAHTGFLSGGRAKQVFTESGLNKSDLAQIWNLADIHNQGKLNSDEFAVAMHLIYAKLAGQEIPKTLPVDLIPPSTKDLFDSVSNLKQILRTNTSYKKSLTISSPTLGIPRLDFDMNTSNLYSEKKTFNQDEDVGYVSSNRRKVRTSPKPSSPNISYSERLIKFDSLRKQIKEKQAEMNSVLSRSNESPISSSTHNEVDLTDLKVKIRHIQDSINEIPIMSNDLLRGKMDLNPVALQAERERLESEFNEITKQLSDLTKKAHDLDDKLANSKLELFKITDVKLHKTAVPKTNLANLFPFKATSSNENLSEADKLKQKAAEMLAQRMQALTKTSFTNNDPAALEAKKRLDAEISKINHEKQQSYQQVREVENSIHHLQEEIRGIIQRTAKSMDQSFPQISKEEYEREKKKWDSRIGLEMEIKKFLDELKDREKKAILSSGASSVQQLNTTFISSSSSHFMTSVPIEVSSISSKNSLVSSAKSKEEKDRYIKEEAERRLKERQSYFQEQLKRTKYQNNTIGIEADNINKSVAGNSYSSGDEKNFLQKSKESPSIIKGNNPISTPGTTGKNGNNVPPTPPPPPPPATTNASLGGYKTVWLNKPSSSENSAKASKSVIPSFTSKSNNLCSNSNAEKIKPISTLNPPTEESSGDEDGRKQESISRKRIEDAKHEQHENIKASPPEQGKPSESHAPISTIPSFIPKPNNLSSSFNYEKMNSESTKEISENKDNFEQEKPFSKPIRKNKPQLNEYAGSKIPTFLVRSNNTSAGVSLNMQHPEPAKLPSEPSQSPKDDEWDVIEKEPTSPSITDFNPVPGHTKYLASALFSSISSSTPFPSQTSNASKLDEAFESSLKANKKRVTSTSTTFNDLFDVQSEPYSPQQEASAQPEQYPDVDNDRVLFRVNTLYDFRTEGPDDLSFLENEYIEVSQASDESDWWYGKLESSGAKGWFPKSYVKQDTGTLEGKHGFSAKVLYNYHGQQDDELSVNAEAVIDILEKIDDNWWKAQVEGHIGLVPASYCEELEQ